MGKVNVKYLGVDATAPTIGEAKRRAATEAAKALKSEPRIFRHRGHLLVVYLFGTCPAYSLFYEGRDGTAFGSCHCDEPIKSGIRHILTNAREQGDFDLPTWAIEQLGRQESIRLLDDWRGSDAFQAAYRAAPATSDGEKHVWAGQNAHRFVQAVPQASLDAIASASK